MELDKQIFTHGGGFRIWDFKVSHSHLLVRHGRSPDDPDSENVDLIFVGVFYMDVPSQFWGLTIDSPSSGELNSLTWRSGKSADETHRYFVLCSQGKRHFIGATRLKIETNKLVGVDSSLDTWYL